MDARASADLPAYAEIAGAVITDVHEMVTDRTPRSEQVAVWLRGVARERLCPSSIQPDGRLTCPNM
jgi:hypothetical protein